MSENSISLACHVCCLICYKTLYSIFRKGMQCATSFATAADTSEPGSELPLKMISYREFSRLRIHSMCVKQAQNADS